jgi:hypothetical protein
MPRWQAYLLVRRWLSILDKNSSAMSAMPNPSKLRVGKGNFAPLSLLVSACIYAVAWLTDLRPQAKEQPGLSNFPPPHSPPPLSPPTYSPRAPAQSAERLLDRSGRKLNCPERKPCGFTAKAGRFTGLPFRIRPFPAIARR